MSAGQAVTIGFFDGVHRGHQYLMQQLKDMAHERGLQSTVVTFDRHPRQVLQSEWQPQLLTSLDEKEELMAQTGIDTLVVLPFSREMAQLSACQFMERVLVRQLGARLLLTGYDNRFGHDRTEGFSDYERYGRELGIEVCAALCWQSDVVAPSSSLIRRLLTGGDVRQAALLLGRPYALSGIVVHGEQVGRRLGFPTANLQLAEPSQLVPQPGVYAVRVTVGNDSRQYMGMTNIGHRPTFSGQQLTIETNIFDFIGDIYQQSLRISFVERLRSEQSFASPEALAQQMEVDAKAALGLMNSE